MLRQITAYFRHGTLVHKCQISVHLSSDIVTQTIPKTSGTFNRINVQVKLTLEQATKAQRGSRGIALCNLGTRWEWVVNATPRPLYPRERPGTHCTGGWVCLRAGLDGYGKSRPHRDSIPGTSSS